MFGIGGNGGAGGAASGVGERRGRRRRWSRRRAGSHRWRRWRRRGRSPLEPAVPAAPAATHWGCSLAWAGPAVRAATRPWEAAVPAVPVALVAPPAPSGSTSASAVPAGTAAQVLTAVPAARRCRRFLGHRFRARLELGRCWRQWWRSYHWDRRGRRHWRLRCCPRLHRVRRGLRRGGGLGAGRTRGCLLRSTPETSRRLRSQIRESPDSPGRFTSFT